jgi:dienelactone hydrolase
VRERRARSSRERVADANAARRWLALVGLSSGATSTLWTVRPRAAVRDGTPVFRSAVALYSGCRRLHDLAWNARIPTLILIGAADAWSPAAPCLQMVKEARARSAHAEIITYPGAHHEFDRPVTERTGLASSADGSGRAHVATHEGARADALRRVPAWLAR